MEFGFEDVKGNSDWVARQASLPLPSPWGPGVLFWATFTWRMSDGSNLEWNWDFKPILHFLHSHPISDFKKPTSSTLMVQLSSPSHRFPTRQVVPTSWILSSQEETSLAAALREAPGDFHLSHPWFGGDQTMPKQQ